MMPNWEDVYQINLEPYHWMRSLRGSIHRMAVFGCWGSVEPIALYRVLGPEQISVVELEEENLRLVKEAYQTIKSRTSDFESTTIDFFVADMTKEVDGLSAGYFDLAFCRRVLAGIHLNGFEQGKPDDLQNAIHEMARVVRPSGWVIADEYPFHPKYERMPEEFFGGTRPIAKGEPLDITPIFENAGLRKINISSAPELAHCYRKS